jgi:hypothetical protein
MRPRIAIGIISLFAYIIKSININIILYFKEYQI